MVDLFSPKEFLTVEELSKRLKLKITTIREKVSKNEIPYIKLGEGKRASVRFLGKDLNEWLTEHRRIPEKTIYPVPEHKKKIRKTKSLVVKEFESFLKDN